MRVLFVVGLFLITQSCSTKTNNPDDWNKNNLRDLEVSDPKVKRAYKAAQDSLAFYIDYFKNYYRKENYSFYLKKSFEDEGEFEHMWSRPFEINEFGFKCILDNEPIGLKNYNRRDTVQIDFKDIEDFIIVTADSTIIGHYFQKQFSDN